MFTGEEAGSRSFFSEGKISEGDEGGASCAVTSSVFGGGASGDGRSFNGGGGGILWGGVRILFHEGRLVSGSVGMLSCET